ncbi:putative Reverse transcriptase (RNA dependent DNA polymerase) [Trypanosoma vivax]|nr:putative Reverse transcriptase (RNA dependent DNA polymerase) [Trypanosoma vivax]
MHCGAPRRGLHRGQATATAGRVQTGAIDAGHAHAGDERSAAAEGWREEAAVFIDYACAFDSVDHGCIVRALVSFGVERHLVARIAGFLKGRTAQVRVSNTLSKDVSLTCGVPQASVLGPLLFIVTVDSLSKRHNCIPGLQHGFFADDLTIVHEC